MESRECNINRTYDRIELLIRRKENYPGRYWSAWIVFLGLLAGILALQTWRNLNLDATLAHEGRHCLTSEDSGYAEANAYAELMRQAMAEQAYLIRAQSGVSRM